MNIITKFFTNLVLKILYRTQTRKYFSASHSCSIKNLRIKLFTSMFVSRITYLQYVQYVVYYNRLHMLF